VSAFDCTMSFERWGGSEELKMPETSNTASAPSCLISAAIGPPHRENGRGGDAARREVGQGSFCPGESGKGGQPVLRELVEQR